MSLFPTPIMRRSAYCEPGLLDVISRLSAAAFAIALAYVQFMW